MPVLPEAGSNYQPLLERHEDAELLSSYRHMGTSLNRAADFKGMVGMPGAQPGCSFLPIKLQWLRGQGTTKRWEVPSVWR